MKDIRCHLGFHDIEYFDDTTRYCIRDKCQKKQRLESIQYTASSPVHYGAWIDHDVHCTLCDQRPQEYLESMYDGHNKHKGDNLTK